MNAGLTDQVALLLSRAQRTITEPAARATLALAAQRLAEPLRVAIAGKVKAGKSTLLNAMVGEELAPTDAGECTRIVTWYQDGPRYRATAHLPDGQAEQRPFDRADGAVRIALGRPADEIDHLTVEVPSRRLRQHTLIDTPGLASLSADVSLRTMSFLEADAERAAETDAVVYLLRHMHSSDLRFLEAFHGDDLVYGTPVNAVGVLSRADEIGACRLDAMEAAGRVASRYQGDERLRRLCPVVVPVAGLLASGAATLREGEYATLARIAAAPERDAVDLLLTADRFTATGGPAGQVERRRALDRMGLFGVRMSVRLIRDGAVSSATDLSRELTARSGLDRLRDTLTAQFVGRSQVLKARSALAALDTVLRGRAGDRAAYELAVAAEQIRASAHEFVEVRLLHLLRSGRLPGRDDQHAEMARLLGGDGTSPAQRLGLPADAQPWQLAAEAERSLRRWQQVAEHPLTGRELGTAARAVARTCEGLLSTLP
ncbi:dynamin family protein [Micromonospora sp. CPCC 206061]|uniref:dynamin family protein n=1 Tax=Micromonospora sp. CPCC 206061 TaxID=3122410 RepID=UPI002FEEEC4B